jgi:hypothetical protein
LAAAPNTSHSIAVGGAAAAAAGAAGAAGGTAGAAAKVRRQAELKAKADAKRLQQGTQDIERLNRVNYHGKNAPVPTNAEWDGDSDFMDLDGTQYTMASRMPISGDVPRDMKLISTKEGRQVYIWTRYRMKGDGGHYFYPAENPNTINELRLFHPADNPGKVNVYYRPGGLRTEQRRVIAKEIPYRTVDILTKGLARKYGIDPKDLEIVPVSDPHGERLREDDVVSEDAAGVGVVATNKKMAKDPRYSTSMTVDVHPDTPAKNLKAFNLIGKGKK